MIFLYGFHQGINHRATIKAARNDDRQLAHEGAKFLDIKCVTLIATKLLPCACDVLASANGRIALAIIAIAPGLEHQGQAKLGDRRFQFGQIGDATHARHWDARIEQCLFLNQLVLHQCDRTRGRPQFVTRRLKFFQMSSIDKFIFQRQHIHPLGQTKKILSGIPITHQAFGRGRRRAIGASLQNHTAIAKPQGRHRGHSRQLTSTDDPQDRGLGNRSK